LSQSDYPDYSSGIMFSRILSRQANSNNCRVNLVAKLLEQINRSGPIRCPLLLISQISRSGGTWVSQLFDHHPQVWAYPFELTIGYPRKWNWPDLSGVRDPQQAWQILRYDKAASRFGEGAYVKGPNNPKPHPMVFSVEIQGAIFLDLAARYPPSTDREWLDIFFTSFFYAWLDYQRRYGDKAYVTAFASMLALEPASMARFRAAYPDGWLMSIIREPLGWYASVKQRSSPDPKRNPRKKHYNGPEEAEASYLENIECMRANRETFGRQFIPLDYSALVADTEALMRALASRIGLDWHPSLMHQTFNGMTINPNTSFPGETAEHRKRILSEAEITWIREGPMMAAYRSISLELSDVGLGRAIRGTS
jgi:hypothetical protein